MLGQPYRKTTFFSRLIRFLFGKWPRLQIIRRGYKFVIVNRYGRTIVHARGPRPIEWAYRELSRPTHRSTVPEWRQRVDRMNARCDEARRKFSEGRI